MKIFYTILFFTLISFNANASSNLSIFLEKYGNSLSVLSATMLQLLPDLQYPKESLKKYKSPLSSRLVSSETFTPTDYKEDTNFELIQNKIASQIKHLTPIEIEMDQADLKSLYDYTFLSTAERFSFDKHPEYPFSLVNNKFDDPLKKLETLKSVLINKEYNFGLKRGSKSWSQVDQILTAVYNFFLLSDAKTRNLEVTPIQHFLPMLSLCSTDLVKDETKQVK